MRLISLQVKRTWNKDHVQDTQYNKTTERCHHWTPAKTVRYYVSYLLPFEVKI